MCLGVADPEAAEEAAREMHGQRTEARPPKPGGQAFASPRPFSASGWGRESSPFGRGAGAGEASRASPLVRRWTRLAGRRSASTDAGRRRAPSLPRRPGDFPRSEGSEDAMARPRRGVRERKTEEQK
jgi:hypothetical protein